MAQEKFSLKDHLFNAETLGQLASEYAAGVPSFDAGAFLTDCVPGLQGRELMARMEWIADCVEAQLASEFSEMAKQVVAAMPAALDPALTDDDFGHFIHAVPGILMVRHGMADPKVALDVLHHATRRFSMEFYIRSFIDAHPALTLETLQIWASDPNYHVRRLVSEGTRPRLPWAKNIHLDALDPLPFLDHLHSDPTRYVTRSVANHLNDISKVDPMAVLDRLTAWQKLGKQSEKELDWMRRHALRTLIKAGHPDAMLHLGFRPDPQVTAQLKLTSTEVTIGDALDFEVTLQSTCQEPVIVDYVLHLRKANGSTAPKVFKLKQIILKPNTPQTLRKRHKMKGDATTFKLFAGDQRIAVQANGKTLADQAFTLDTA